MVILTSPQQVFGVVTALSSKSERRYEMSGRANNKNKGIVIERDANNQIKDDKITMHV